MGPIQWQLDTISTGSVGVGWMVHGLDFIWHSLCFGGGGGMVVTWTDEWCIGLSGDGDQERISSVFRLPRVRLSLSQSPAKSLPSTLLDSSLLHRR